jgi:hypothetical protein
VITDCPQTSDEYAEEMTALAQQNRQMGYCYVGEEVTHQRLKCYPALLFTNKDKACVAVGVDDVQPDTDLVARPPKSHPQEGKICDFEHQCYPAQGGPAETPVIVHSPPPRAEPPATHELDSGDAIAEEFGRCLSQAMQGYYQSHDLHGLQMTSGNCQMQLRARISETMFRAMTAESSPFPQREGRRNIGCGWWPIGSDADHDCAQGR